MDTIPASEMRLQVAFAALARKVALDLPEGLPAVLGVFRQHGVSEAWAEAAMEDGSTPMRAFDEHQADPARILKPDGSQATGSATPSPSSFSAVKGTADGSAREVAASGSQGEGVRATGHGESLIHSVLTPLPDAAPIINPCRLCGLPAGSGSLGGRDICAPCDCGVPPEVSRIRGQLTAAQAEIATAHSLLDSGSHVAEGPGADHLRTLTLAERIKEVLAGWEFTIDKREKADAEIARLSLQLHEAQQGWRCFHCDEVLTTPGAASDHFGVEGDDPGCLIDRVALEEVGKPERGRGLLMALRKTEDRVRELRGELDRVENDARLWHESEADRVRRIGNVQWWQEIDYRDGEKLALREQVTSLSSQLAGLRNFTESMAITFRNYYGHAISRSVVDAKLQEWLELRAALAVSQEPPQTEKS